MMKVAATICFIFMFFSCISCKYTNSWDSLDTRPLPEWYDEAKFGIFMHWGVYSVPSYSSEWFWEQWKGQKVPSIVEFMKHNYPPDFTYPDFAPMFKAELFNPDEWTTLFKNAGAKYKIKLSNKI